MTGYGSLVLIVVYYRPLLFERVRVFRTIATIVGPSGQHLPCCSWRACAKDRLRARLFDQTPTSSQYQLKHGCHPEALPPPHLRREERTSLVCPSHSGTMGRLTPRGSRASVSEEQRTLYPPASHRQNYTRPTLPQPRLLSLATAVIVENSSGPKSYTHIAAV